MFQDPALLRSIPEKGWGNRVRLEKISLAPPSLCLSCPSLWALCHVHFRSSPSCVPFFFLFLTLFFPGCCLPDHPSSPSLNLFAPFSPALCSFFLPPPPSFVLTDGARILSSPSLAPGEKERERACAAPGALRQKAGSAHTWS